MTERFPAPWKGRWEEVNRVILKDANGNDIVEIYMDDMGNEAETNLYHIVRLIKSAPRLLEACEAAYAWLCRIYPDDVFPGRGDENSDGIAARNAREDCRAAIAEAKGEGE